MTQEVLETEVQEEESSLRRPRREVAQRLFAAEFNSSTLEVRPEGSRAPSYVVSPLGARVNRLFFVGVLTQCEPIGNSGEMWRAQVYDPTGIFHVYSGQYQPEASAALSELHPPTIVAVQGKSRTYSPQTGVVYSSVRPERITVVGIEERNRWVLETARHTLQRIRRIREARSLGSPEVRTLESLGLDPQEAEGIVRALAHYKGEEVERIIQAVRDALDSLLPGSSVGGPVSSPPPLPLEGNALDESLAREEVEETVLELVGALDQGKGAPWDELVRESSKKGLSEGDVEEAINSLMDKGLIFEPVLGRLRRT